jgi:hypothetical protein
MDAVAVDASGNIYTGGARISNLTTYKRNSSGGVIWSRDHGTFLTDIAVDQNGNVYTIGVRSGGIATRKYDSVGNLVWSIDYLGGSVPRSIAVDPDGNVYTGGDRGFSAPTFVILQKNDSDGNLIWAIDSPSGTFAASRQLALDLYGNIYTVLGSNNPDKIVKFDSDGNLVYSLDLLSGQPGAFQARGRAAHPLLGAFPGEW